MANDITILLVDDIADVRENVKKLLSFEQDMKVVGSAGSGREGIQLAKELKPDIIIMDINMPDIDGITATQEIKKFLPAVGVIMMSVQSDRDYMRRAMTAGASDFLTKPAQMDDLYNTIRSVYKVMASARQLQATIASGTLPTAQTTSSESQSEGDRAGNVIVCYSSKGGVGTTTIATNLASGLMREGTKVLLVDGDVQFGDVGIFLNLKAQATLSDIIEDSDDIEFDMFQNILVSHPSGLQALLAPARPEFAESVFAIPRGVASIIESVRYHYDFVIVDTSCRLDDVTISLCDIATHILLIATPTLPSVRETRNVLDLFDQLYEDDSQTKIKLVMNQVIEEKRGPRVTIAEETIVKHLKREIYQSIPNEPKPILNAIIRGLPIVAMDRDSNRPPTVELMSLANKLHAELMGENKAAGGSGDPVQDNNKNTGGLSGLFRR